MKIAIISINMYSKGLNFACPLHTYAFQQFLLKNGIETTILSYKPIYFDGFDMRHPYDYYAERVRLQKERVVTTEEERKHRDAKIAEYTKKRNSWKPLYADRELRYEKFQAFIDTRYQKTEFCYNSDLLEAKDPGFDCYICATDVIWKNQPGFGYDRGFFLASTAMENKWKIAYAASRGGYLAKSREEDEQFFHYLEDFDYLSVREDSLKEYVESNTGRQVSWVLDPVLLHERDFYDNIAIKPEEEGYLLLYYVAEKAADTIQQAVNYANAHHLKIVEITDVAVKNGRLKKYDVDYVFRYAIGIEEWIGYFQNAKCVFTNSFHACCLCMLFEKDFYVGSRRSDKVAGIMNAFGLGYRIINMETDLISQTPQAIDWVPVREILDRRRRESSSFILSALRDLEGRERAPRDYTADKKLLTYPILYNSRKKLKVFKGLITWDYSVQEGSVKRLDSGSVEYTPADNRITNDGSAVFHRNGFSYKFHHFTGWYIRLKIDNFWFWYLEDGSLELIVDGQPCELPRKLFKDGETIPYLHINRIRTVVAEAIWERGTQDV